eukprot:g35427.t1
MIVCEMNGNKGFCYVEPTAGNVLLPGATGFGNLIFQMIGTDSDSHAVLSANYNLNKENPDGQLDEDINTDSKSLRDFGTAFGTNDTGKPSV